MATLTYRLVEVIDVPEFLMGLFSVAEVGPCQTHDQDFEINTRAALDARRINSEVSMALQQPGDVTTAENTHEEFLQMKGTSLGAIEDSLHRANSMMVACIRVFGNLPEVRLTRADAAECGLFWSFDGKSWRGIGERQRVRLEWRNSILMSPELRAFIEGRIADGDFPFSAWEHLDNARLASESRTKWIHATIAAELGIKEFLVNVKPELGPIVMELPAPPLGKLYGPLLEEYGGERSPYRRELEDGAAKRNRLVHRPETTDIGYQEAIVYVSTVEMALMHLEALRFKFKGMPFPVSLDDPRPVETDGIEARTPSGLIPLLEAIRRLIGSGEITPAAASARLIESGIPPSIADLALRCMTGPVARPFLP